MALPGLLVMWVLTGCVEQDVAAPATMRPSYDSYSFGTYELVTGSTWQSTQISNQRVIGAAGGRLTLGLHQLMVPAGAVTRPTRFRMSKVFGEQVRIDLTAFNLVTNAAIDSFPRPVELWLSYRFAHISNTELEDVAVLWLKESSEGVEQIPVPTRVERRTKHVVGSLTHFSQYAMGMN
jgi:hypothetical protein